MGAEPLSGLLLFYRPFWPQTLVGLVSSDLGGACGRTRARPSIAAHSTLPAPRPHHGAVLVFVRRRAHLAGAPPGGGLPLPLLRGRRGGCFLFSGVVRAQSFGLLLGEVGHELRVESGQGVVLGLHLQALPRHGTFALASVRERSLSLQPICRAVFLNSKKKKNVEG